MFTYIKDLIETKREVYSLFLILKNKLNNCRDYTLSNYECKTLGIRRGGYISAILAMYKELENERNK